MGFRSIGVCAGIGGLELGLKIAEGAAPVCLIESEPWCWEVLASRFPDAFIWSDATTFDPRPWVGLVDGVIAGIPCQPWSQAGQRRGFDDGRHLGDALIRILRVLRPQWVFVENVLGFVRKALPQLLIELARLGYDAEWDVFSSAEVGAAHRRRRLFLLAHSRCFELPEWRPEPPHWEVGDQSDLNRSRLQVFAPPPEAGWQRLRPTIPGLGGVVTRATRRLDAPLRAGRLKAVGNSVCPLAAAFAWYVLKSRFYE